MLKRMLLIAMFALAFASASRVKADDPWPECFPCPEEKGLIEVVR